MTEKKQSAVVWVLRCLIAQHYRALLCCLSITQSRVHQQDILHFELKKIITKHKYVDSERSRKPTQIQTKDVLTVRRKC